MTVREWIAQRSTAVPVLLTEQILELLGSDASGDAASTAQYCLAAATRSLDELLGAGRFSRDSALRLLAVDALMTFAFEHASESAASQEDMRDFAADAAGAMAQLAVQHG
jgi:hypothetical protein